MAGSLARHGAQWRVGVREPLVAAGVGGGAEASGWWPVVLAPCAEHREPSRLDVAPVVLAQVRYQVGFASLEPNLGVGGELAADVGGGSLGQRCSEPGFLRAMTKGRSIVSSLV